jgi:hypothetical protein
VTDDEIVNALLAAAGLTPSSDETQTLVAAYPVIKGMVDVVYSVDAARYVDMCLSFRAESTWVDWAQAPRSSSDE